MAPSEVDVVLFAFGVAAAAVCEPAEVRKVLDAIPAVSVEQQGMLAALGLSEACPRAGAFTEAAARLGQVMPEMRRMVDAELALKDPRGWMAVCPGGPGALASSVQLAPAQGRELLWKSCGLAERGWFELAEWSKLDGPVVVPLVAGKLLADSGIAAGDVRTLVRALVGLPHPNTKPPEPLMPFLEPLPQIPEPPVE